ncbi:DNA polymerase IV [Clostridium sp. D33t1_170424_F3]|uniref:DNA polymerase IV n=1 Tax=Clostridium sp. D33t1_170424_F3 TaxID=2787099 RepID=UPI00336A82E7
MILHCDCNAFYASVECQLHPEYREVPMAVCGDPEQRHGIILAKNEWAKKYGVQTAETIWRAKEKCPQLVLAKPHREKYAEYSKRVNEIYQRFTDLVEPFGIDESWLDVTGSQNLFGSGPEIADTLRKVVKKETGLTISVGVSFNKIFSKLGSDYKKPDATTVITKDSIPRIVFPLPVDRLLYVGKSARETMQEMGICTIGELARADRNLLLAKLGKIGGDLYDYANGLDESPVKSIYEVREVKSVGNSLTFKRNLLGLEDVRLGITVLADTVAARMRRSGVKCTTVQITIRNPSFKTITRQKPLPVATFLAKELAKAAMQLILECWNLRAPIRMLALTGLNLFREEEAPGEQLSLFQESHQNEREKQEHLETALDRIRTKYGKGAISICGVLQNDIGAE